MANNCVFFFIPSDCGSPTSPDNGTVILTEAGITTYGASATQSCNIGFNLTGVIDIKCGAGGNWSDPAVSCTIKGYLHTIEKIYVSSCIH